MGRAVVQITLFGLLLALDSTLANKDNWDIYSFHINSTVTSRYATSVITSRVANRMDESKEIEFHVRLPKNAFITKFRLFIDGEVYDGVVKAKEQAQQQYHDAVSRGQSAGIVSSVGRTLEEFKTSVTVAAHKKVTFELTYEELLKRRLGKYELQIHARPMQPVKDFKVDVHIHEKSGIGFIKVSGGLSTKDLANAITKTHADKQAWVHFYPTEDQQKTCDNCGGNGMNGDLIVAYDVNRDNSMGDIKTGDGYFVHHFAPSNLSRIPKNVVFVIDRSGSMNGKKMRQTKAALIRILNDLAEDDYFGLVTFDSDLFHWKRELVQATAQNVDGAKKFAQQITDRGATDINLAVLEGARMLNAHPREGSASILILLTDGDPTTGVTNLEAIQSNVRKAIAQKFPLYCLGFGFDVNFEFLEKMALENNGVARRIYEDSDADLQLKGFYEEVATPLLTHVTMTYIGGTNLTQTNFSQYYNGSEIVVAGQITDNNMETFVPQVVAISRENRVRFSDTNATMEPSESVSDAHIQRLWAYLTVKQLLEKELQLSGEEKTKVKKEALELSLKYNFVTPLTSMVVTKPQGEHAEVLHKPREGASPPLQPRYPVAHAGVPHLSKITRVNTKATPAVTRRFYPVLNAGRGAGGGGGRWSIMTDYSDLEMDSAAGMVINVNLQPTVVHLSMDETEILPSIAPTTVTVPLSHRFLLKPENQTLPLCYDVTGNARLKLLHHTNRAVSVNGELDSVHNGGFTKIVIHFKAAHYVEIDFNKIIIHERFSASSHSGEDLFILSGRLTVIKRNKEINVSIGNIRIVILLHTKDGAEFLWPAVRQRLSNTTEGIFGVKPTGYEEVQQTPVTKLKINNQEIDVTRSSAVDYSIDSHPTLECWLMSAEDALQRPLDEFVVAQL